MKFSEKHKVRLSPFTYETPENHPYEKSSKLAVKNGLETVYTVKSLYINKGGRYGDEGVIVTDQFVLNAPNPMTDTIKDIIKDAESVELIELGKVGFKLYEYTNKHGKQHNVEWVDI